MLHCWIHLLLPLLTLAMSLEGCTVTPKNHAAPRAGLPRQLAEEIVIDGKLFLNGLFVPIYPLSTRQQLQASIACLLPTPLADIIASYLGFIAPTPLGPFVQKLYGELYMNKLGTFAEALYDVKRNALKEHAFWKHLSKAGQSAHLVFVQMLWGALWMRSQPKVCRNFSELVACKVPRMAYFVRHFMERDIDDLVVGSVSPDEWPHELIDCTSYWNGVAASDVRRQALRFHFLLAHRKFEQLRAKWPAFDNFCAQDWLVFLGFLHAANGTVLADFFRVGLGSGSYMGKGLFMATAPIAASLDPAMQRFLQKQAETNHWQPPDFSGGPLELAAVKDCEQAGGSVHLQPLMPFALRLAGTKGGKGVAMSLSGKTVLLDDAQLFVSSGNMLHAVKISVHSYLFTRKFADGKVSSCACADYVPVNLEHGDVIAVSWWNEWPLFFRDPVDFRGLSCEDYFEHFKSLCYLAKSRVDFVAIAQSDRLVEL